MGIDAVRVGEQIHLLRRVKNMTQSELGQRLGVSAQAVSRWERGENMPDVSLLLDLASALETTTDNILSGGVRPAGYTRKVSVEQARKALESIEMIGELLGKNNMFYIGAIEGIDRKMNIEFENYMHDEFTKEAMLAEALIQCMMCGAYVDMSDVRREFKNEHWVRILQEYATKYGIA